MAGIVSLIRIVTVFLLLFLLILLVLMFRLLMVFPTTSIGVTRVLSIPSRIRSSAVPAGLSPLLFPSRVPTSLSMASFFLSLSSRSSIVILLMMVAMVAGPLMP